MALSSFSPLSAVFFDCSSSSELSLLERDVPSSDPDLDPDLDRELDLDLRDERPEQLDGVRDEDEAKQDDNVGEEERLLPVLDELLSLSSALSSLLDDESEPEVDFLLRRRAASAGRPSLAKFCRTRSSSSSGFVAVGFDEEVKCGGGCW